MATCEKCWKDAQDRAFNNQEKNVPEHYHDLIGERYNSPCSAEEQAGDNASFCNRCERLTIHQHTHKCVLCEKD
jgi:hypothetical protein